MPPSERTLTLLQLSDPHLLADARGRCRGRDALLQLHHGLAAALRQCGSRPDLLLISGDLCQDESWGGYVHLRALLAELPFPVAVTPGNHEQSSLLRAVLGRRALVAPSWCRLGSWTLVLLNSHQPGCAGGRLGDRQIRWLTHNLTNSEGPVLLALHHPPVPIGDPGFDAMGLADGDRLMDVVRAEPRIRVVVFGHIHQHWRGADRHGLSSALLGCPSTLVQAPPVQPCPLGRPEWPGGRLLQLWPDGGWRDTLLRWPDPSQ
ncbi:3',5'-cyclic-nucleotide phosphodiesterase [Synechococcus sp. RSCCF101]|uniref:metallophosphoesterase n=1 Tax=Synechococcus sp. RSCCF101 TaxID=2511069 RepID=UPI0012477B59|nr:metallophosphoesterase [Synechococcus sp. RSCCF101]QEY33084.1 3',5'-cyclic-nucleotide phosphodiesterase [Synechococcus sp. RSCCF101]